MDKLIWQGLSLLLGLGMQADNMSLQVSSREMRAIETNAEYFGIGLLQLMENAGRCVAQAVMKRFSNVERIVFFCGLGGNGGDGFVAARHLLVQGYNVTVILAGRSRDICHSAAAQNWRALKAVVGERVCMFEVLDSSAIPVVGADVVVDALLGTGSKGGLRAPILQLVECINSLKAFKIAVDVPTGVDSDTGEVLSGAVRADLTVTFYKSKPGLVNARGFVGDLEVCDIGLPFELERLTGSGDVGLACKPRFSDAHKGCFGRLLVIGGSSVFSGAPALASLAALRTGVDVVYTASPERTAHDIAALSPDLISVNLSGENLCRANIDELIPYLQMIDAVVLGPGLGLKAETCDFVKLFIDHVETAGKTLLLDADGLKAFAFCKRPLKIPLVLTPHMGEFEVLTGKRLPENIVEKTDIIQRTARELNAVLLVKGKIDIICSSSRIKWNFTGNAGMTVGGTGDVLSGIIGALLAQKTAAFEAATAGAFINGACGDFAASKKGFHILASDLLEWIPQTCTDPMSHLKVQHHSNRF
ncbi:MAG: NAD(P)H-hydrate dehydratase [Candidatus Bathyarchaeota archaeon]|nr:NAD(P)H-hydrate dehydratase [Candidatus Termiticorpusculum sp.]